MRSTVAVVRTSPSRVLEDTEDVMRLAGLQQALKAGSTTILKDNISWHFPFLSANTTPWQLEGVILGLRASGFEDLAAVHNDTVVTNPFKGGELNRLAPLYAAHDVPEIYNFRETDVRWVPYKPKAEMLVLNKLYPEGIRLPDYFFGKNVVHLPTMKCHIYTTTTGAMKNAFGGLLNTKRHYTHTWIHETLVDLLAIQREIHSGLFAVMDGTLAGDGPGPRTMRPVQADLILASSDQVAIDAVAAKLMGFDPMSITYIRLAHERGLGVGDPREIDVVGEDISGVNLHFTVGSNFASRAGRLLWFGPLKPLQHVFFHTPVVNAFIAASFVYHDWVWWPLRGKPLMRRLRRDNEWGRFFQRY
jgi:uncharacterized protein (DUF362 family)